MGKLTTSQFKFRKNDHVGATSAEDDAEYLSKCFYDNGSLEVLQDTSDLKRILVGRTGAGKTALLLRLQEIEANTVFLDPMHLSLQYLSNSTILRDLAKIGVNLDLFYKLLWKHIFCVELIKLKYGINGQNDRQGFFDRVRDIFYKDKAKQEAIDYLLEWGDSFWKGSESRIQEVTSKLESKIKDELKANFQILGGSLGGVDTVSEEIKTSLVNRLQSIVSNIQIVKINHIVDTLAREVFHEAVPGYFVVIDKLDDNWIEDSVRYYLIRALIETVRDMKRLKGAKIVVALRRDLLDRVIDVTRDAGFQEEKYHPFYLEMKWLPGELLALLDLRINELVRRTYTKAAVSFQDIMPSHVDGTVISEYMIDRTMRRPRDILEFFNACVGQATDKATFSAQIVKDAEAAYSRRRLRSLADEWFGDYPSLLDFALILRRKPKAFHVGDVDLDALEDKCLEVATAKTPIGELHFNAAKVLNDELTIKQFLYLLMRVFYVVGLVGLKVEAGSRVSWSFIDGRIVNINQINDDTRVEISPAFYRELGVNPRG